MDDASNTNGSTGAAYSPDQNIAMNAEWLATVSHELRSPLMAIKGYVDLLLQYEDRLLDGERREFLQEISKGSNHIASVLDSFLILARFETGDVHVHLEPVDLLQLLQQVLLKFSESIGDEAGTVQRSIHILTEFDTHTVEDPQDSIIMMADRGLLQVMLMQLLDNAHKYSPTTASIDIGLGLNTAAQWRTLVPEQASAHIESSQQMMVEIRIQDYGIGIPAHYHDAIFQRFYRVDMNLTRDVAGLGLGLTICQYIVTLHRGIIWVESLPDVGSTIHVLLPVQ